MGKDSSTPQAPDYEKLAWTQGRINQQTIDRQTAANRVNQYSPYGSVTWQNNPAQTRTFNSTAYNDAMSAYQKAVDAANRQSAYSAANGGSSFSGDGVGYGANAMRAKGSSGSSGLVAPNRDDFYDTDSIDNWTQTTTLDPASQQLLDSQRANDLAAAGIYRNALGRVGENIGSSLSFEGAPTAGKLDYSGLSAMPESGFGAVQEVQDAMMSRLNPALQQGRDREVQRLKAQGITEGTPAWQAAMQSLGQKDNDANQRALLGATSAYNDVFNRGMQNRQQGMREADSMYNSTVQDRSRFIQELLMKRQVPLNELSAFRSGSQVTMPSFPGYSQAGQAGATDIMGANNMAYKAAMDNANANAAANNSAGRGIGGLLGGLAGTFLLPGMGTSAGAAIGSGIGGLFS